VPPRMKMLTTSCALIDTTAAANTIKAKAKDRCSFQLRRPPLAVGPRPIPLSMAIKLITQCIIEGHVCWKIVTWSFVGRGIQKAKTSQTAKKHGYKYLLIESNYTYKCLGV
jgi:hypothetical protein